MSPPPEPSLVCPLTHAPLTPRGDRLCTADGRHCYPVVDGIPCCVHPPRPRGEDAEWQGFYDWLAPFYDASERVLGRAITGVDMVAARREIGAALPLQAGEAILEVSPGPGIYQGMIARGIGPAGHCTALDLSLGMLRQCRRRTRGQTPRPRLVQGNAAYLPFADGSFDGLFHFGGLNLFTEPGRALAEFARVVRPGGWVVFGDEGFSARWQGRRDWRPRLLRRLNPGYDRRPPDTPDALECIAELEVFGGLGYLRICRARAG